MSATNNTKAETPIYWMLRRLKALRDCGIDVTLDDLFSVAERADRTLTVEELVDAVEVRAFYRKNPGR